jgi:hypothetical protein
MSEMAALFSRNHVDAHKATLSADPDDYLCRFKEHAAECIQNAYE